MLNIDTISKSFGDQVLLDKTGFQINTGERIGLVGRNGHGKTTLLNLIIGLDEPDEGQIALPGGYRIGFLAQKIAFTKDRVIDEAMLGLVDHEKDHYWKAEKILSGLGFSDEEMQKSPYQFSGGYQVRLNLAKVLVSQPDLLILDEPTNYLDITSIRWITSFLTAWPREVLLVTHDRGFMDKVVTHVAGIHRAKIKKIQGDTSKYYLQVAQDEEVWEKTRVNEEKKRKEIELFISRFRAKARLANMVQSRIKTLEKSKTKEKLSRIKQLDFQFNSVPFAGKQVLIAENLSFAFKESTTLFKNLNLTVYPQDRIAVIGKNGKGKTTLLKVLHGDLSPRHGEIRYHPAVKTGYFEQTNVTTLTDSFTIEEELLISCEDADRQAARSICGAMMFEKDAALKKIKVLSGGEKSRVMLGKLLLTPVNLLLLDEPSNHLDMESCDAFIEALDDFEGAVVLVTHNEMFLHALANRLVVFRQDGVEVFDGTYQEFLDKDGWEESLDGVEKRKKKPQQNKKRIRQRKSELVAEKSKQIKPVKRKIDQLEAQIERNDHAIATVNEQLLAASVNQEGQTIQILSKQLAQLEQENEDLFDRLEQQTDLFDSIEDRYDKLIKECERIE